MGNKRRKAEEIVAKLRQEEVLTAGAGYCGGHSIYRREGSLQLPMALGVWRAERRLGKAPERTRGRE